ncbi:hypothetical protein LSUB1_G001709 [Lachnellula subtilissima]|uniref:Xylanolytic transcriptional activator regulatory domain-containing protein n=1 Tax=Lachnellula subtilissima TaxID=602034 RepID=A0A8H8RSM0_9HELO|nr:hypothetical protein LSUB1_G001709 [Lachnellula subtilissima]
MSPAATTSNPISNSEEKTLTLSCETCRSDRARPNCALCLKSQQSCFYRQAPSKPGPKVGSTQRGQKRARTNKGEARNKSTSRDEGSGEEAQQSDCTRISIATSSRTTNTAFLPTVLDQNPTAWNPRDLSSPRSIGNERYLSPESLDSPKSGTIGMHDLSFIIHPSHESTHTQKRDGNHGSFSASEPFSKINLESSSVLHRACAALDISSGTMDSLIDAYFANMTAFSLFRPSCFRAKVSAITSLTQVNALLTSMFSFSARFIEHGGDSTMLQTTLGETKPKSMAEHFGRLALVFLDEALRECEDDTPSLCLLQALTLSTFRQLIRGARGRGWRSLGTCVRAAYELNLHLIDANHITTDMPFIDSDPETWCADEEKRRTWWAIWEMDTFASTVRRCPTAIDWSQNETRLPTDDSLWFAGEPHGSCFLDPNPMNRWRHIQECGSKSAKAWFIIVNSLMRDAQQLSSPRPVFPFSSLGEHSKLKSKTATAFGRKNCAEITQGLGILENALHCFSIALPESLQYQQENLRFPRPGTNQSLLMRNSSIYSIHIMIQLANFMIYQHGVFGGGRREHILAKGTYEKNARGPSSDPVPPSTVKPDEEGLGHYIDASDEVLAVVSRSSNDHFKYVNPFLASTIWVAASVQLVYKFFAQPGSNKSLTESKYQVLCLNITQFVKYWDVSDNLQKNLDCLQSALERFHEHQQQGGAGQQKSNGKSIQNLMDYSVQLNSQTEDLHEDGSNQVSDRWRHDFQDTNLQNTQSSPPPVEFGQFSNLNTAAAHLGTELEFPDSIDEQFPSYPLPDLNLTDSPVDLQGYLNGFFIGGGFQ